MFNKKTKLKLTDFECNLLGGGMNEFRNMLLSGCIPHRRHIVFCLNKLKEIQTMCYNQCCKNYLKIYIYRKCCI